MPVLRIKQDGIWKDLGGTSPMNGGNADTLDGFDSTYFAPNEQVSNAFNDVDTRFNTLNEDLTNKFDGIDNAFNTLNENLNGAFGNVYDTCNNLNERLNSVNGLVGDEPVSDQINNALENFSSGKTLTEHLAEEDMILSSRQYGDKLPGEDGEPYTHVQGRIFFKRVSE